MNTTFGISSAYFFGRKTQILMDTGWIELLPWNNSVIFFSVIFMYLYFSLNTQSVLNQTGWLKPRGKICLWAYYPPPPTVRWGGRTPGFYQSPHYCQSPNRLNIHMHQRQISFLDVCLITINEKKCFMILQRVHFILQTFANPPHSSSVTWHQYFVVHVGTPKLIVRTW